jgi:hypothetical protein
MTTPNLDARLHLLRHNREGIMVMLKKSAAAGLAIEDSVAIIADTRDSVGAPMSTAMAARIGDLDPDAEASRALDRGEIPTSVAVLPARLAVELFAGSNPTVSAGIEQGAPTGRVRVVGAGGSTLVHVPLVTMGGGGSA